MQHLSAHGVTVHLDLPVDGIEQRIRNLPTRAVVMEKGQTIRSLYNQRQPLCCRHAHLTTGCTDKNRGQIVAEIVRALTKSTSPSQPASSRRSQLYLTS